MKFKIAWIHASRAKRVNPKAPFEFPQLPCYSTDVTENAVCLSKYLTSDLFTLGTPMV